MSEAAAKSSEGGAMNETKALLDAGNLNGAIEAALNYVKTNPTDARARTFLFELSLFSGDWKRAEKQLDVIGHQDAKAMIGTVIYRQCLEAEQKRERLFSEGLAPEFLTAPPAYVDDLLDAINRVREGNTDEARKMLDDIEEKRPAFPCTINGEEAADFRDYNDMTHCVLEAFIKSSYAWVPIEQIVRIDFTPPKNLRDLFWLEAKVEMTNGTKGEMLLPTLYAGSYKSPDDQVRLGRATDWRDLGSEIFSGEGVKVFWADGKEKPILSIREIEFRKA